jgi:uncharacterized protein YjbJ (UPF0337 family)
MKANGHLIETLTRSEMFQSYERAFVQTTGMPTAFRPVETWQLPFHGKRKENAFFADNDLQYAEGQQDELVGRIQKRTGETREAVEKAVNESCSDCSCN